MLEKKVATRQSYGEALRDLGQKNKNIVYNYFVIWG